MRSNSTKLTENVVKVSSSIHNDDFLAEYKRRSSNDRSKMMMTSGMLTKGDLNELREMLGSIRLAGYAPSTEVEQIVTSFDRVGSNFYARLAIRALRLEQALNVAQERIIRLEWYLVSTTKIM